MDIVDKVTRSRMMSGIRSQNTRQEILIRSLLHRQGFRFRLNVKNMPGKPDIVLAKYQSVIFMHGCFWHGHTNCSLFKMPKTREDFWKEKIEGNQQRDQRTRTSLLASSWRVAIIWECALRGKGKDPQQVCNALAEWLKGNEDTLEIKA